MLVPIPYVIEGIGALMAVTSLPLVFKMVPMNRSYGIRLREAYVSEANWYALNAFGGKVLLVYGLVLLGFGYVSLNFAPPPTSPLAPLFLIIPLLVGGPLLVLIKVYARRLPEE